jgi:hypothetical protein
MPFCVDTSAWLDGWQRHYPPDVFPTLWTKLDQLVSAGEIVSSEEVYVELERKADDLHGWVKARKEMLVPLTAEVQEAAAGLLSEYPRLVDTLRGRSKADPFVIATAMQIEGAVVVTGEIATGRLDKPRIPDVCRARGINCITFLQMIRDLKLTF